MSKSGMRQQDHEIFLVSGVSVSGLSTRVGYNGVIGGVIKRDTRQHYLHKVRCRDRPDAIIIFICKIYRYRKYRRELIISDRESSVRFSCVQSSCTHVRGTICWQTLK